MTFLASRSGWSRRFLHRTIEHGAAPNENQSYFRARVPPPRIHFAQRNWT
jgi:hypothetical protein